ncbi:hypothetical protein [Mycolicibacterium septicum]|uniref:hypothetical protein n=1 Tax=Mycolicibacterium septicum TaxID=98668 RepID=UPI00235F4C9B|nr:hypothetical protein [Mycolicibacterium septicum]
MTSVWRQMDIYLPLTLTRDEVRTQLRRELQHSANDRGEFAAEIRVEGCIEHSGDWRKWQVAYLPGPPGVLQVDTDGHRISA